MEKKVEVLVKNLSDLDEQLKEMKIKNEEINKEIEEITLKLPLQMVIRNKF